MELREKIVAAINAAWDDENSERTVQSAADAILAIPEIRDALEAYGNGYAAGFRAGKGWSPNAQP